MDFLIETYALIAVIPFISFIFIYYLLILTKQAKKKALNLSIDITSLLLITAVSGQMNYLFQIKYGILLSILFTVLIIFFIAFLQWKIKGKVNYKRMIKATSRLGFISFSLFYLIFFVMGFFIT